MPLLDDEQIILLNMEVWIFLDIFGSYKLHY